MNKRHQKERSTSRITLNHLLIVVLALLIGIRVSITNRIATSGKELNRLEEQSLELEQANQKLLSQDVEKISIRELQLKAKQQGFIEPDKVIHLGDDTRDLASRPSKKNITPFPAGGLLINKAL